MQEHLHNPEESILPYDVVTLPSQGLFYTNKKNFKIPFKTYYKTIVIGRNCEILNGLDSVFVGQNRFQDFLRDVYKMWDFFTPTILVEGNKYVLDDKIHKFFIEEQMNYKMFYLQVI